jgi:hypothetical protein
VLVLPDVSSTRSLCAQVCSDTIIEGEARLLLREWRTIGATAAGDQGRFSYSYHIVTFRFSPMLGLEPESAATAILT